MNSVLLVTRREFRTNLLKRSSLLTLILSTVVIVVAILGADWFFNRDSDDGGTPVAVVGEAPFLAGAAPDSPFADTLSTTIETVPADDESAARTLLLDGDVDAALIPGADGQWTLLEESSPSGSLSPTIEQLLITQAQTDALTAEGVDPTVVGEAVSGVQLTTEILNENDMAVVGVTMFGVALLFMAIMMFGGAVATSVIEEKSSRVVEIVLSTVRPLQLLAGKVLGAGAAGLVMFSVMIGAGAIAFSTTTFAEGFEMPWGAIGLMIPFFILSYLFFACVYAASASLVSRMEDFSAAQMPVLLLALLSIYVPAFGLTQLDSTLMQIAAWIPPLSGTVAPLQFAAGNLGAWEIIVIMVLFAAACVLVAWLAAVIYPRNVLRTGARVSWRKAFSK